MHSFVRLVVVSCGCRSRSSGSRVYGRAPDGITFELVQPPQVLGTPSPDAPD